VTVPPGSGFTHRAKVVFYVVTSPCWLAFGGLMITLAVMLTGISLMVDSLFLAPMVGIVHVLLRHLAS
jgi:hypothetical protein